MGAIFIKFRTKLSSNFKDFANPKAEKTRMLFFALLLPFLTFGSELKHLETSDSRDVFNENRNALTFAARDGKTEIVKRLLEEGAEPRFALKSKLFGNFKQEIKDSISKADKGKELYKNRGWVEKYFNFESRADKEEKLYKKSSYKSNLTFR